MLVIRCLFALLLFGVAVAAYEPCHCGVSGGGEAHQLPATAALAVPAQLKILSIYLLFSH